ncbi:hypothetical protein P171DRAFT_445738 [Karstenula rhodostoma CBS 690.94]|uniref:Uncharacterized protein n=1 Tax=Karstenula rhodostoma CBS 690.94 TaxID=1392251 RepID=A0A9P4UAP0_9PLEO|nr:hypothetical protein P171DRAFT_445738 [Karstenula rhodostoma CBS 690.94]
MFDRFAEFLTTVIQSSGNLDADNRTMDVDDPETYFAVRWAYLNIPIFIVLFAALFLVISIVESRKYDHLLKTSTPAVMYHGLDARDQMRESGEAEKKSRTRATANDLVQESKGASVVFVDEGRMRLQKE